VSESVFRQRVRAAGLSLWELGDLLGIHPHHLHTTTGPGPNVSAAALIDLARRLDMHPADLIPALDTVLTNTRRGTDPDDVAGFGKPTGDATPDTALATDQLAAAVMAASNGMAATAAVSDANTLAADGAVVLTALAYAVEPLSADNLAEVLD
jgi:hypothetical protein